MKILFLSHYFPPEVNAPASRTYEHCREWVRNGHHVTVVTCAPNHPKGRVYDGYRNGLWQRENRDGIDVWRVWTYVTANEGFLKRTLNYLSYMVATIVAAPFLPTVDVVISTSPQFFNGLAGYAVSRQKHAPWVLEIRDLWPESIVAVGAMRRNFVIRVLEWLEKKLYQSADHIVTVGEDYRQGLIDRGVDEDEISVIPNGVDLTQFMRADGSAIRSEFGAGDRFVCGYIGTVGMAHGLEVMLNAAEMLKQQGRDDIQFWIVGDGARRAELEQMAAEKGLTNVRFTGLLPKEKMPEVISACDSCLVHLKGADLFSTVMPSKVFEYMALDVPIIMGVRGQACEIVEQGKAGIPMTPDDPRSLLDCIAEIRRKGSNAYQGRDYVAKHFNRDKLASRMLETLLDVVHEAHPTIPLITHKKAG